MWSTSVCLAETFYSWHHDVFLALLKITLMYVCMHIYCYWQIINLHVCTYQSILESMLISYTIYNRLGIFVNECIPNITYATITENIQEWLQFFFYLDGSKSTSTCTFLGSRLTPCHDMISPKKEYWYIWKGICLCLALGWPLCITLVVCLMLYHGLSLNYQNLQSECCQ